MRSGLISNIQKYSLQDGPGIRTTVFLKGCPLRCAWCHNPENIAPRPQVVLFKARCIRCGECATVCPERGAAQPIAAGEPIPEPTEGSRCQACGACVEACPTGARVLIGQPTTVDQLLAEILADRVFYDESGGGVTFSGGEPLSQAVFLRDTLAACRNQEIHTAVDTCGLTPLDDLLGLAPLVDLFLYDLKLMDEERHRHFCGATNGLILDNLRALAESHANIWIRIPLIPGVNDLPEELDAMARFIVGLHGVCQVNLLPYHRTGIQKFQRLGKEYGLPDVRPPPEEQIQLAARHFVAAGLNTKVGG